MCALHQIIGRLRRDERGAALVEMTLITPFMLLLSAGVFEFSNILQTRLSIEAGIEDAARYLARCSDTWTTCVAHAKNLAVNGVITGGGARISGWTAAQIPDPTLTPYAATNPVTGAQIYLSSTGTVNVVTVSTSHPYSGTGLWGYLGFGTLNITASHQERVLGW
ncbi:MAG TPA: TadE/TadG family type IV pilus assembly protein [Devosiaceae bacterium]|nr:TadE/TadG family type IV pilus assembly protein [Devosiaceae bacterium]